MTGWFEHFRVFTFDINKQTYTHTRTMGCVADIYRSCVCVCVCVIYKH